MPQSLRGFFLGRRAYAPTFALMEQLFLERRNGAIGDTVLLLEHEPVITLGRGSHPENLLADPATLGALGVSVVPTGRGGDVTLHAPGQLIVYPIINLCPDRMDVRKYVQNLTQAMKETAAAYGVAGGTINKMIGFWVDGEAPGTWQDEASARSPQKLGAIGVRISRWITQHGFALNLTTDLSLFSLIVPCGISEFPVTSIQTLTGQSPTIRQAAELALLSLNQSLGQGEAMFVDAESLSPDEVIELARAPQGE